VRGAARRGMTQLVVLVFEAAHDDLGDLEALAGAVAKAYVL